LEKQFLTAECKDILQSLMEINPTKRLSACEALNHPWLQNGNEKIDLFRSDLQDIIFTEKEK
jgi:serine/threonine protein kinase